MTYFRSQYTYTTLIILGILLFIQPLINGCTVGIKYPEIVPGCFLPPDVFKKYGVDLEIASANIGDFTIGKIDVNYKPDLIKVLSDLSRDQLVVDYLVCVAEHRGEIQNAEQAMYLRNKLQFMQSKPPPTADDILKYEKEHPFPTNKGKLDISGTDRVNKAKHKIFWKEPKDVTRKIGVINSGDCDLIWWLDKFPFPFFFSDADDKKSRNLKPKDSSTFTIVRTITPIDLKQTSYPFDIKADTNETITVEIVVEPKVAGAYFKLSRELYMALQDIDNGKERYSATKAHLWGSQKDNAFYELANSITRKKFPYEKESIRQLINAQLLSKVSQYDAALIAFKQVAALDPAIAGNSQYKRLVVNTVRLADTETLPVPGAADPGGAAGMSYTAITGILGIVVVIIGLLIL